jgi:mono/diheme cytochrome c family protein
MSKLSTTTILGAALLFSASSLVSCTRDANDPGSEYAPDMYHSKAYEPLRQNAGEYNPYNYREGGINMRLPVAGTVPRGKLAYYNHIPKDSLAQASAKLQNPYEYNEANFAQGKVLYTRYCQPCHGETGNGQGPVGVKYKGVANFASDAVKGASQGHIFHVITNGKGRMWPHGSQVNPEERWKIAMYVRSLQGQAPPAGDATAPANNGEGETPADQANPAGQSDVNTNPTTGTTTDPTKDTAN